MALDAPAIGKIQIKTEVSNKPFQENGKDPSWSPSNQQRAQNAMLGYEDDATFQDVIQSHQNFTRPKADVKSQLKVLMSENKQLVNSDPYTARAHLNSLGPTMDYLKANKNQASLGREARKAQKR